MSELNLIPYELKAKKFKIVKIRKYIAYAIIIFSVFVFIVFIPKGYLMFLKSQESAINLKISGNSKLILENKKLLSDTKNYKMYNDKVDLITKQKINVTGKIKNLEKYIPKDVYLANINLSNGTINITGGTSNYNSISIFTANLQMSKEYKNSRIVNISASDSNTNGKYQFSILITE